MKNVESTGTEQPTPAAPKYTCPMHPEVVRPTPGRCPKCNMLLEPKKSSNAGTR